MNYTPAELTPYERLRTEVVSIEAKIRRLQHSHHIKSNSLHTKYDKTTGLRYDDANSSYGKLSK